MTKDRIAAARARYSLYAYFTMGCPPLKIVPSHGGIWTHLLWFPIGPTRVYTPQGHLDWFSRFCRAAEHGRFSRIRLATPMCTPCNACFLGPPDPQTQTTSRSVQPFNHAMHFSASAVAIVIPPLSLSVAFASPD